ncbi:hypothetical protein PHLCEN_2v1921 [Hermanssonia centrifuga]|uniref:Uncharacterized protein n=1 Tax=Hermanssonia centrifuga TaxID=98765 RepID=A0A2R6RVG3_9APHY|nr:hypothetical protein PHLCEN_2v1921 [Hermanssonia centrifuga]
MGNRFSVAKDEQDEAEFRQLVEAVESAQRRVGANDVEAYPRYNNGQGVMNQVRYQNIQLPSSYTEYDDPRDAQAGYPARLNDVYTNEKVSPVQIFAPPVQPECCAVLPDGEFALTCIPISHHYPETNRSPSLRAAPPGTVIVPLDRCASTRSDSPTNHFNARTGSWSPVSLVPGPSSEFQVKLESPQPRRVQRSLSERSEEDRDETQVPDQVVRGRTRKTVALGGRRPRTSTGSPPSIWLRRRSRDRDNSNGGSRSRRSPSLCIALQSSDSLPASAAEATPPRSPVRVIVRARSGSRRSYRVVSTARSRRSRSPIILRDTQRCTARSRGSTSMSPMILEGRRRRRPSRSPRVVPTARSQGFMRSTSRAHRDIVKSARFHGWERSRTPSIEEYVQNTANMVTCDSRSRSPRGIISRSRSRSPLRVIRSRSPLPTTTEALAETPVAIKLQSIVTCLEKITHEIAQGQEANLRAVRERDEYILHLLREMEQKLTKHTNHRPRSPSINSDGAIHVIKRRETRSSLRSLEVKKLEDVALKAYPNIPYAAGLRLATQKQPFTCTLEWKPAWQVFPLKAFRGSDFAYLKIQSDWDDEALLSELGRVYDRLRTFWRKWFSLRSLHYHGTGVLSRSTFSEKLAADDVCFESLIIRSYTLNELARRVSALRKTCAYDIF